MDISTLPTINACLNATSAVLLFSGWKAVKSGRKDIHKKLMISALISSSLFLVGYLTYHHYHGVTHYPKHGLWKFTYFSILLTHTPLATIIVPFCIMAVYFAIKGDFKRHVKITKWLYPVWMYVSVTGVLIYLMLYIF